MNSMLSALSSSPVALMVVAFLLMLFAGLICFLLITQYPKMKGRAQKKRLNRVLKYVLPQFGGTVISGSPQVDETFYASITVGGREIELRDYELEAEVSVPGQVDSTFLFVPCEQDLELLLVQKEVVHKFFNNYRELEAIDCETLGASAKYLLLSNDLERAKRIVMDSEFVALLKILEQDYKNSYLLLVPTKNRNNLSRKFAFHYSAGLLLCRVGLSYFLEQEESRAKELVNQMVSVAEYLERT